MGGERSMNSEIGNLVCNLVVLFFFMGVSGCKIERAENKTVKSWSLKLDFLDLVLVLLFICF